MKKRVLLLAGEESGQIYARRLAERLTDCEVRGYDSYGFATADLAVFGFFAVLRRIFFFLRVKRTMRRAIDEWRPDVVCTIDYPGMNLRLAAYAKSRGIRAVHVVCPQVWAWHRGRIPKVEAALDALCCFFPFEPRLFRPGFASFVGHPLVADFAAEMSRLTTSPREKGLVALLPGSRRGEISLILPRLLAAAKMLDAAHFEIPAANARARVEIERLVSASGLGQRVRVSSGGARSLLCRAECAAVASGTATLEAALARCPTVLVYCLSPLLAAIARRVIKGTRFVGLANVVWDRCRTDRSSDAGQPMPELLQENFTAKAVVAQLGVWLSDGVAREKAVASLDAAVGFLGNGIGAIDSIAERIAASATSVTR